MEKFGKMSVEYYPTMEEYLRAVELAEKYKICDYCHTLVRKEDMTKTTYFGNVKFWHEACYEHVKDDD